MGNKTKALLAAVLVFGLTGAACGRGDGGSGSDCTSQNATKLSGTITVKDAVFHPNCFSVASGSTISVVNDDVLGHNFTVTGTNIAVPLPHGQTGEATAPLPGTYDFLCTIHQGMKGTIIVT